MKKKKSLIAKILFFSISSSQALCPAFALDPNTLPSGYSSVAGNVQFNQTPNNFNVSTSSHNAIAEYNNFSIGKDASVNFFLPSSNSAILNRVNSNIPSQIFGSLWSNGRVFLVNPNGILFGSSAIVNVNSLMASTLNLSNQDFFNQNYVFKQLNSSPNSIVNQGIITTQSGGLINLFAGAISNSGSLSSLNGQINLAVGEQISFINNGLGFQVSVDEKLKNKVAEFNTAISNSGSISSSDGLVSLQADISNSIYDLAVNNSGLISATQANFQNGFVEFISPSGNILNSGKIESSGLTYLEANSLENYGQISSLDGDVNIITFGYKTITRLNPDQTLIHSPFGSTDFPLTARNPYQQIDFGLFNAPNASIKAGNDLNILTTKLFNTSASLEAGRDLNIKADSLINDRAGLFTENIPLGWGGSRPSPYVNGLWEKDDYYDKYEYWIDRIGSLPEGRIKAERDINLLVKDTINSNSLIENGKDLNVEGNNFTNSAKVLMGTQYHQWKPDGSKSYYEPSNTARNSNSFSSVLVGGDANFDLERNLNNNSVLAVNEDLNVKANNLNNGIINNLVPTPRAARLPSSFILPYWPNVPKDLAALKALKNEDFSGLANLISSQLFNLTGKTYLDLKYKSAKDTLKELIDNSFEASRFDSSLESGIGLNEEQIKNLKKPILWLVGQNLMVYLPENYQSESSPEGLIEANNINLEINNKFYNSGSVIASDNLKIKANEIINEKRTVARSHNVRENSGLFGSRRKTVWTEELQAGGNLIGNNISLEAENSIRNTGGNISANNDLNLEAPEIINEVSEGSRLINIKSGFLDKAIGGTQTYSLASVYAPGSLKAGNDINIEANTFTNRGSDVIANNNVNIKATNLIEQDWVASHHTVKDNYSVRGFSVQRDTETEHVSRGSNIVALNGDVNLQTAGKFKNTASDVYAGNNLTVKANAIEVKDGIHQSTDRHERLGIDAQMGQVGVNYTNTEKTKTTQRSSNFQAGNNMALEAERDVNIIGSNLLAENRLTLSGENVNIQNGLYEDKHTTTGGGINAGFSPQRGLSLTGNIYEANSSQEVLTKSSLAAKQIEINAKNKVNIQASEIKAEDSININTPNLSISGEYANSESEMQGGSLGVKPDVINGGLTVNASYQAQETEGGKYISSSLNAPIINLNSPNQVIEGTSINRKAINPQSDYENSNSYGMGVSINPFNGQVGLSLNYDEFSIFGSLGQGRGSFGGGYENWIAGTSFGNSNGSVGTSQGLFIGNSAFGTLGVSHSTTQGNSVHDVLSTNFNVFGFSGGVAFQEGEYIGSTINFGKNELYSSLNNNFNYTCFPKGTKISLMDGGLRNIEEIKIGDKVLSFNENTKEIEEKEVEKVFIREAKKILEISLANGKMIRPTPDHEFYLNGKWVQAKDLKVHDELLDLGLNKVQILSIEERLGDTVYNFTVRDNHNYFAENILVHNTDYDKNKQFGVVLQGYATKSYEKSVASGYNISRSYNDLIQVTQNNPNLTFVQRFVFSNRLGFLEHDVLRASTGEIQNSKNPTRKEVNKIIKEINKAQRDNILKATEGIAASIYQSVLDMGKFPSTSPPSPKATGNGVNACAWAVNQVLNGAGIDTLGGVNYLAVKAVEKDLRNGRGLELDQAEAKAGDITLVNNGISKQHIGVCLNDGCTLVRSNSSSKAEFSWDGSAGFDYPGSPYHGLIPKFYRVIKEK